MYPCKGHLGCWLRVKGSLQGLVSFGAARSVVYEPRNTKWAQIDASGRLKQCM